MENASVAPKALLAELPVVLLRQLSFQSYSADLGILQSLDSTDYDSAAQNMLLWAKQVLEG